MQALIEASLCRIISDSLLILAIVSCVVRHTPLDFETFKAAKQAQLFYVQQLNSE